MFFLSCRGDSDLTVKEKSLWNLLLSKSTDLKLKGNIICYPITGMRQSVQYCSFLKDSRSHTSHTSKNLGPINHTFCWTRTKTNWTDNNRNTMSMCLCVGVLWGGPTQEELLTSEKPYFACNRTMRTTFFCARLLGVMLIFFFHRDAAVS